MPWKCRVIASVEIYMSEYECPARIPQVSWIKIKLSRGRDRMRAAYLNPSRLVGTVSRGATAWKPALKIQSLISFLKIAYCRRSRAWFVRFLFEIARSLSLAKSILVVWAFCSRRTSKERFAVRRISYVRLSWRESVSQSLIMVDAVRQTITASHSTLVLWPPPRISSQS